MVAARDKSRQEREVELKLAFAPADAGRLAVSSALAAPVTPPEEHILVSTYFDTPDFALHRAGVYLRVRENAGRYTQTIKSAKTNAELLERFEWEQEIPRGIPDLDAARGTALEPLLTPERRATIRPVFATRIRRKIFRFAQDGSEIEAAIDQGEIAASARTCAVSELELELKGGAKHALFVLARRFAETVPLRLEMKTKAERGYELVQDGGGKAEKATGIEIPPELAAGAAFQAIARNCLRQVVANEPATRAGEPESLHQMRIGLRRLRAAIAVFDKIVGDDEAEKIKAELKWIARELGPARDLHVFAAEVLQPLRASRPSDAGLATANREIEKSRSEAYSRAAAAIGSDRFRNFMLDLAAWIETGPWTEGKAGRTGTVAKHAKKELARLRKRVKRKGADLRHLSESQRHRLRIRGKRLRYAAEFFAATFSGEGSDKRNAELVSALKDLQDGLGGLNDLATRRALITEGLAGSASEGAQLAASVGLDETAPQAEALLLKSEQAFARFAAVKPFWKA
jgi:triphosphatase